MKRLLGAILPLMLSTACTELVRQPTEPAASKPPATASAARTPAVRPVEATGVVSASQRLVVAFDDARMMLADQVKRQLADVADALVRDRSLRVQLFGYAPQAGSREFNLGQSRQAINVVHDFLVQQQVRASQIRRSPYGEEYAGTGLGRYAWVEIHVLGARAN